MVVRHRRGGAVPSETVDAFADLFAANADYASRFGLGDLAAPPTRHVAVVTCMDARIDPLAILGLAPGEAHVLRNAGARVTDDVLRSLVKSVNQLDVTRVAVMHHTDCGAAKIKLPSLRVKVTEATGHDPVDVDFHLIDDQDESLRADVQAVRDCPYLPVGVEVVGLMYDVRTGVAEPKLSTVVA
jgi:carbonic anhydrase